MNFEARGIEITKSSLDNSPILPILDLHHQKSYTFRNRRNISWFRLTHQKSITYSLMSSNVDRRIRMFDCSRSIRGLLRFKFNQPAFELITNHFVHSLDSTIKSIFNGSLSALEVVTCSPPFVYLSLSFSISISDCLLLLCFWIRQYRTFGRNANTS